MATKNDNKTSLNPFIQALRGKEKDGGHAASQRSGEEKSIVAATVEALSKDDSKGNLVNQAAAVSAPTTPSPADNGRMEAVVDLLFGNHLTEINASMRTLEKQVAERINKAESEMRTRIESLDRHTKGEVDTLTKALEKEGHTRDDAVAKLGDRIDSAMKQLEQRLEKMEARFARDHEEAQKDVNERLTTASDTTTKLREGMEQEITSMKASLSTRAELGAMFAELGKRLDANASGSSLDD